MGGSDCSRDPWLSVPHSRGVWLWRIVGHLHVERTPARLTPDQKKDEVGLLISRNGNRQVAFSIKLLLAISAVAPTATATAIKGQHRWRERSLPQHRRRKTDNIVARQSSQFPSFGLESFFSPCGNNVGRFVPASTAGWVVRCTPRLISKSPESARILHGSCTQHSRGNQTRDCRQLRMPRSIPRKIISGG
jgi:hypothetical protein